jgi:ketosteroid isomerase-like protein
MSLRFRLAGGAQTPGWLLLTGQERAARLVVALLMVGTIAGCERSDAAEELARQWFDALNSHDTDALVELLEPGATYTDPAPPEAIPPAAVRDRLRLTWSVWKDQVYTPKSIITHGNLASIEWHVQQTNLRGRELQLDGVTILEFHNRRIQHVRNYFDVGPYLLLSKPQ